MKRLIQEQLNIPEERQILFVHNDFQTNNQQIIPYLTETISLFVKGYVVDSSSSIALLCVELSNKTRHALLLDKSKTVSDLNKVILQKFGYAIQAQEIRLQQEARTQNGTSEILSGDMQLTTGSTILLSSKSQHLFWRKTSSLDEVHECQILPSALVQTLTDDLAQKLEVSPSRVQLFHSVSHQELVNKDRLLSSYNLEAGQIIDVTIRPLATRIVRIIFSTGKILELDLVTDDCVRELKKILQDCTSIDVCYQVIRKDDRELLDDELISNCLGDSNGPLNVNFILSGPLMLDLSVLGSNFDYDYTIPYEEFHGGKRIVFDTKKRHGTNDCKLDLTGADVEEWSVSYHGMGKHNTMSIAEKGYKLIQHRQSDFREGIFTTPELCVAKNDATELEHDGEKYFVLFENRVNPKYLKVIDNQQTGDGLYWVSMKYGTDNSNNDVSELIRPYAICIFKDPC